MNLLFTTYTCKNFSVYLPEQRITSTFFIHWRKWYKSRVHNDFKHRKVFKLYTCVTYTSRRCDILRFTVFIWYVHKRTSLGKLKLFARHKFTNIEHISVLNVISTFYINSALTRTLCIWSLLTSLGRRDFRKSIHDKIILIYPHSRSSTLVFMKSEWKQ